MDIKGPSSYKWQLSCCALCQLTCSNVTPFGELVWQLKRLKRESERKWGPNNRDSGETAVFVISSPGEDVLERNLETLGFKVITKFSRRNGYPPVGKLKMWFLDITQPNPYLD